MQAGLERPSTRPGGLVGVGRPLLAVAMVTLGASCFDGADALGLPCGSDDDCGNGQRCELGVCGGPPATTSETASGSSGSSSGSSSGPDPTVAESTGLLPNCGNGVVEPELGEDCDPGTETDEPMCDYDCTSSSCGDGYANLTAEECDDGNETFFDACTPQCRETLFWDDMGRNPALAEQWLPPQIPTHPFDMMEFSLDEGWRWGAPMESDVWYSGPYSAESGTARLVTRPITFPADPGPGLRYELRLHHRLRFDGNPQDVGACSESTSDGGVVWILERGQPLRPAGPPPRHPDAIDNPGLCSTELGEPDNPLYDPRMPRPAYSGITNDFVEDGFPLPPDVAGKTLQLVFEVGYDCRNCWAGAVPPGAGWTIDDVVVAAFPG
jgi:cysteine-rich repeat protein